MLRFPCTKQQRPLVALCIGFLLKIALRAEIQGFEKKQFRKIKSIFSLLEIVNYILFS